MDRTEFFKSLKTSVPQILAHLQQTSDRFGLAFKPESFNYFQLSVQEKVVLDFLAGCPGLPHSNWGDEDADRRRRLPEFVASQEFKDYCESLKSGGSVIGGKTIEILNQCLQQHQLPNWLHELATTLNQKAIPADSFFVVISLKQASEDFLTRMKRLLAHEWTHLLFFSQGIKFQTQSHPDAWLYDEGLATWIEYVYDTGQWDCQERLEKLHQFVLDRGDPRSATGYFEFGVWFNQHFKTIPLSSWPQALRQLAEKQPD